MPALFDYHIFISHAWKYGDSYTRLVNMLNGAPNFKYCNYSAPKDKPLQNLNATDVITKSQIKAAIDRKIRPCGCVVVLAGMYAAHREWMQYEIDTARRMGKPIIAVRPWGSSMMPSAVTAVATEVVGWNTASIVSAIRNNVK